MKRQRKQPAGQRQLRVGEEMRHVISASLQHGGFDDPALMQSSLITVTEVRIAPDLKNATVYVMPLGGRRIAETLAALNANAFAFQRDIARQMKMKFTPRLNFKADESFDEADKIERIIQQIHDES
ncbi:MAG: 30S ribosome-binding factor RbfA [Rhodospirillales bacterium]|nr:30S ribosome-binding factor RbfA [Alphaproteobacteria bacterium]MCB9987452.1 30S ribosome-binding factor RbfA [Rhodospirillales bacterium]USO07569.1 MAG: 30S ribosome-binding factor RbfA [Rhodospirillales bacterium]